MGVFRSALNTYSSRSEFWLLVAFNTQWLFHNQVGPSQCVPKHRVNCHKAGKCIYGIIALAHRLFEEESGRRIHTVWIADRAFVEVDWLFREVEMHGGRWGDLSFEISREPTYLVKVSWVLRS